MVDNILSLFHSSLQPGAAATSVKRSCVHTGNIGAFHLDNPSLILEELVSDSSFQLALALKRESSLASE